MLPFCVHARQGIPRAISTDDICALNLTLLRSYLMDPDDEDECLTKAIGTDITWKAGKNLCVRMVEKKQKKKGKVRTVKVEEPTDSFFQFFDPPAIPEEEEEMEEEEVRTRERRARSCRHAPTRPLLLMLRDPRHHSSSLRWACHIAPHAPHHPTLTRNRTLCERATL